MISNHKLNMKARKAIGAKFGEYDLIVFSLRPGKWDWHIRLHGEGDRDNSGRLTRYVGGLRIFGGGGLFGAACLSAYFLSWGCAASGPT